MNLTLIVDNVKQFAIAHPRVIAGAAVGACILMASRGSGPEPTAPPEVPAQATPAPVTGPTRAELAEAAWKRAWPMIVASDEASRDEMLLRVRQLDDYLDGRKAGADAFAREVTSLEGQMQFVGGLGEQALVGSVNGLDDAAHYLFGSRVLDKKLAPPEDRFAAHVRDKFRENVLDPADVNRAIKSAVLGYTARLQALENGLLVDLKADLPDPSVGGAVKFDVEEFHLPGHLDGLVSDTTATVGGDLIVAVIQDQVASQIGSIAASLIKGFIGDMGGDVSKVQGLETAINMGAELGVSTAISKGLESQGYDPAGQIKAKVAICIDRLHSSVIYGDKLALDSYYFLLTCRFGHPDPAARSACEAALRAIERDPRLGIAPKLMGLHVRKSNQRVTALRAAIFDEPPAPFLSSGGDERAKQASADVISLANKCVTLYGGVEPK